PSTNPDTSCNSCFDFISSDETLDRCDAIIVASGWKLTSYQRKPVFQNAHQYGDIIFTLSRALITEVRTRQPSTINSQPSTYLFKRIEFATDVNPMAKIAYGLYRGKFLNAVSVGFIPLKWENGDENRSSRREEALTEKSKIDQSLLASAATAQARYRRRYLEQELLE